MTESHVSGQPSPTGGDLTLTQVNDIRRRENERIFKMLKDRAEKLAMRRMRMI